MITGHSRLKFNAFLICFVLVIQLSLLLNWSIHQNYQHAQAQTTSKLIDESIVKKNFTEPHEVSEDTPFYVENTKSNNIRVLSLDPIPSVEVTYSGNSSIYGSPTQTIGTIIDTMGKDGSIHSVGKAIILISTGEIMTYRSESIGYYNSDGSFSDNGVILFSLPFYNPNNNKTSPEIDSNDNPYSKFNNVLGIYKKTVDVSGNGITTVWKWG